MAVVKKLANQLQLTPEEYASGMLAAWQPDAAIVRGLVGMGLTRGKAAGVLEAVRESANKIDLQDAKTRMILGIQGRIAILDRSIAVAERMGQPRVVGQLIAVQHKIIMDVVQMLDGQIGVASEDPTLIIDAEWEGS